MELVLIIIFAGLLKEDKEKIINYYLEGLKKYAVFEGRSRRKEYWIFIFFNIIIFILNFYISYTTCLIFPSYTFTVFIFCNLAILISSIAVGVRRLHDIGYSGWWLFIVLVPVIGLIVFLILTLEDSQPGENQYGPNPKEINVV